MRPLPANLWDGFKEVSRFFEGRDQVHKTMFRLARRLELAGIDYAVAGGMAVNAHGHAQTTGDGDVLLTPGGLERFLSLFVPKHYRAVPQRRRKFIDRVNHVPVDFLLTGDYPGDGHPGPVAFPDPARVAMTINQVRYVELDTLLRLKLAAMRYQDLADVISLIRVHGLTESLADRLPALLRLAFTDCLEARRREDEWEVALDEAMLP
jgi:hypothetical protein